MNGIDLDQQIKYIDTGQYGVFVTGKQGYAYFGRPLDDMMGDDGEPDNGEFSWMGIHAAYPQERAEVNGGFPAEMYRRIFEDHPEVDAYVSLCGPPWDLPDASDPLPEIVPPLIVALGLSPEINIEPLFDHGILEMAVTLRPRHGLDSKTAPRRGRAMFDYYYQVVTAASGE